MEKTLFPMMSRDEKERLTATLEDMSRNSMIRTEIMLKRGEGKTVEQACVELSDETGLSQERIRNIYYQR